MKKKLLLSKFRAYFDNFMSTKEYKGSRDVDTCTI